MLLSSSADECKTHCPGDDGWQRVLNRSLPLQKVEAPSVKANTSLRSAWKRLDFSREEEKEGADPFQ